MEQNTLTQYLYIRLKAVLLEKAINDFLKTKQLEESFAEKIRQTHMKIMVEFQQVEQQSEMLLKTVAEVYDIESAESFDEAIEKVMTSTLTASTTTIKDFQNQLQQIFADYGVFETVELVFPFEEIPL